MTAKSDRYVHTDLHEQQFKNTTLRDCEWKTHLFISKTVLHNDLKNAWNVTQQNPPNFMQNLISVTALQYNKNNYSMQHHCFKS